MKQPSILVVGSLVMDLICSTRRFPNSGETVLGIDFQTAPGGKGANQAMQAALLNARVSMIGKVGADSFGQQIKASLEGAGVNVTSIGTAEGMATAVGNIQLEVTETGTANRILVIPGANMTLVPEDVYHLEEIISRYDMVVLQLEIPMEINLLVAQIAHRHGVPVMLNPAPAALLPDELLACITYLSPNEHEAEILTGISVVDEESVKRAAHYLLQKGVKSVLITLGSRGAAYLDETQYLVSPCTNYGPVIDPTAAGDSFIGAFCTAICEGQKPQQAMVFANHTAGITVSRMGAQPSLPARTEVEMFMRRTGAMDEKNQ